MHAGLRQSDGRRASEPASAGDRPPTKPGEPGQVTATRDFHQEVRKVVVVVVVASRPVTAVMVTLGALAGIQARAYTQLEPALLIYGVAVAWGLVSVVIALRAGRVPDWVLAVDTGILTLSASLLPWFARTEAFGVSLAETGGTAPCTTVHCGF